MFLTQEAFHEPVKGSKSPSRPWSPELAPGHSRVGSRVAAKQGHWDNRWTWGRGHLAFFRGAAGVCLDVGLRSCSPGLGWLALRGLGACALHVGGLNVDVGVSGPGRGCESACCVRACGRGVHGEYTVAGHGLTWCVGVRDLRSERARCEGLCSVRAPPVCECDVLHTGVHCVQACCMHVRVLHVRVCLRVCTQPCAVWVLETARGRVRVHETA